MRGDACMTCTVACFFFFFLFFLVVVHVFHTHFDSVIPLRMIMTCAMLIRGVNCTLSPGYKVAPPTTCPVCYGRYWLRLKAHAHFIEHTFLRFRTSEADVVYLNAMFNLPLVMMMLTALIILSFWTDIYSRCMELTKFEAASRSLAQTLLSKLAM
jgi:hypothetical protein